MDCGFIVDLLQRLYCLGIIMNDSDSKIYLTMQIHQIMVINIL